MDITSKDTTGGSLNPKDFVGIKKVPFSTIPAEVTAEVGLAFLEGALKYGKHNWRVSGVRASVYYDALLRHVTDWWEGTDSDPDSGLNHLVKGLACLYILRDSQRVGRLIDDRPPSLPSGWVSEMNEHAKVLIEKYPNPKEAYVKDGQP